MSDSRVQPSRILFVCTGNICRSPTAEVVVREKARAVGLDGRLELASAGTTGHHVGDPPDRRAIETARRRGYDLTPLRARRLQRADFESFDLLLAMTDSHLRQMHALASDGQAHKLRMFLDFAPAAGTRDVPDPYYDGGRAFETMLDLIEQGADGLLEALRTEEAWR